MDTNERLKPEQGSSQSVYDAVLIGALADRYTIARQVENRALPPVQARLLTLKRNTEGYHE